MKKNDRINFSPYLWGNHAWRFFSYIALSFPENPSFEEKNAYKDFFMSLQFILPCDKCKINYQKHIKELPIDDFLKNKDTLFSWTIQMQNKVNQKLNKPLLNEEKIKETYFNIPKNDKKVKLIFVLLSFIGFYFLLRTFMSLKIKIKFKH